MRVITTDLFWDCNCEENYIHSSEEPTCQICGATRDESADARADEVVRHASEFGLDEKLVRQVRINQIISELGF